MATLRFSSKPQGMQTIWWLHPAVAFSAPALLAGATAYFTGPRAYLYFWRTAKYFDRSCLNTLLAIIAVFVFGCVLGAARRPGNVSSEDWRLAIRWPAVRWCFMLSFLLTVAAYVVWILVGVKNGLNLSVVLDIIHQSGSADYNLREDYLQTIPGVTTGTQFGIAVMALAAPLGVKLGWRHVRWQCLIVLAFALLRSFLNSERLAVLELLVPFAVSYIWVQTPKRRLARLVIRAAPLLAAAMLYLLFSAGEYYRSWSSFYAQRESSFWSFTGLRLMGYYTTALNNGALIWRVNQPLALHYPMDTLDFLWRFPVLKDALFRLFPGITSFAGTAPNLRYMQLLSTSANPELNNPSGVFLPLIDYGLAGGLLYWLVAGVICGYLYSEFKQRSVAGVFLYPVLYISLIEATRILYWAGGRFFPGMTVLVIGVALLFKSKSVLRKPWITQARWSEHSNCNLNP